MTKLPEHKYHYENFVFDDSRWDNFKRRKGDIAVCTSYKAGTTWTQMICALLVFKSPDLPRTLAEISPWLDMRLASIDDVVANYEAQSHRRFIKTHTPLDALPFDKDVQYVYCGREPRDVYMSMENHFENMNMERIGELLAAQGLDVEPPPPLPENINDRFALWMTTGMFEWEQDGLPFWSHFRHGQSFWEHRHLPNVHFLHFADLKADLEGEMRSLADKLGEHIDEDAWPALVKAATFDDMKSKAHERAPDTNHGVWHNTSKFFNKGANEQWRGALSDESLALYDKLSRERYDHTFLDWLEQGSLKTHRPKNN
jgi:aryl sulfotransferase